MPNKVPELGELVQAGKKVQTIEEKPTGLSEITTASYDLKLKTQVEPAEPLDFSAAYGELGGQLLARPHGEEDNG